MRLQLITLSGVKFEGDVYEVLLPTLEGEIGVLDLHMPLVSVAKSGFVAVRKNRTDPDSEREYFVISGGIIKVEDNQLVVMVDEADHADEINEAEAKIAYERALKAKAEAKDEASLEQASAMVDRTNARLHVAGLKRRKTK